MEAHVPKRILLATVGSLGDLHPMLALGLELKRRGHRITIAATEYYRSKVEGLELGFWAMRPNWDPTDRNLIAQCEDLKSGPEVLFRRMVLPHLRGTYDDLLAAAEGCDMLLTGEMVFAAPLIAEKLGLRWVSVILSPTSFFSAYDPSLLVTAPWLYTFRRAGWVFNRAVLEVASVATWPWWQPVRRLRREVGLGPGRNPAMRDKFSPYLVLALFSHRFAQSQPDWPRQTVQPGFLFLDRSSEYGPAAGEPSPALKSFLDAGEPPLVFTLGSTAVHNPGNFYSASAAAARSRGRRAILLGIDHPPGFTSDDVLALPYAPYSQIFPHAAAIIHQGGSGTTGQALRAGKPQLIVPYGWDQPDNGVRIERLGAGLCLARSLYTPQTAAAALDRLPELAARAEELGQSIRDEDALTPACDAIETAAWRNF